MPADYRQTVERRRSSSPCSERSLAEFPHKPSAFHMAFSRPCGRRGKHGAPLARCRLVLQTSSNPQPRFRKLTCTSSPYLAKTSSEFPLFLRELRVLLSFISLILLFSSYPSRVPVGSPAESNPLPRALSQAAAQLPWNRRARRGVVAQFFVCERPGSLLPTRRSLVFI